MADTTFTFKFNADVNGAKGSFSKLASSAKASSEALAKAMQKIEANLLSMDDRIAQQQLKIKEAMFNRDRSTSKYASSINKLKDELLGLKQTEEGLTSSWRATKTRMEEVADEMIKLSEVVEKNRAKANDIEVMPFHLDKSKDMENVAKLRKEADEAEASIYKLDEEYSKLEDTQKKYEDLIGTNVDKQDELNRKIEEEESVAQQAGEIQNAKVQETIDGLDKLQDEQVESMHQMEAYKKAYKQATANERWERVKNAVKGVVGVVRNLASEMLKAATAAAKFSGKLAITTLKGMGNALTAPFKILKNGVFSKLGAVLGIGLIAGLKKASSAANELTDTIGVTSAAFGDSAQEMVDWASTTAQSYGLSRAAALKYFSTVGEYLKNTGVDAGTSATVAKNLAVKSADISRAYGISQEAAKGALMKALAGGKGTKALAKYGITITDTALEQELLNEGIHKTYNELSSADQAIVRYNLVMRQLKDVTGTASDGLTTWEGAVLSMSNSAKDALASLGLILQHYLLPVVQVIARFMQTLSGALSDLMAKLGVSVPSAEPLEDYADGVNDVGDAIEGAGEKGEKASKGLASFDKINNLTTSSGSSGGGVKASGIIDAANALGNMPTSPFKSLKEMFDDIMNADWGKAGAKVAGSINKILGAVSNLQKKTKNVHLGKKLADFANGIVKNTDFKKAGEVVSDFLDGIITNIQEFVSGINWGTVSLKVTEFWDGFSARLFGTDGEESILSKATTSLATVANGIAGIFVKLFVGDTQEEKAAAEERIKNIREGLSDAIKRGLETLDAKKIGKGAAGAAKAITAALRGVFNVSNAKLAGGKLGDLVSSFVDEGTVEDLAGTVSDILVSLVAMMGNLAKNVDMLEVGRQLINGIATSFTKNSGELGESVGNILNSLGDLMIGFFNGKDMKELGKAFGDATNKAVETGGVSRLAEGATTVALGIIDAITGFITTVNWLDLATAILSGIGNAIVSNKGALFEGLGLVLTWSAVSHLFTGLTGIGEGIVGKVAAPIESAGLAGGVVATAAVGLGLAIKSAISSLTDYIDSINAVYEKTEAAMNLVSNYKGEAQQNITEAAQTDLFERQKQLDEANKLYRGAVTDFNSLGHELEESTWGLTTAYKGKIEGIVEDLKGYYTTASELGLDSSEHLQAMKTALDEIESSLEKGTTTDVNNAWATLNTAMAEAYASTEDYNKSIEKAMEELSKKSQAEKAEAEALESQVKKDSEAIGELDEAMAKIQNDDLIKYIQKVSDEELDKFGKAMDSARDSVQGFLDKTKELLELKWDGNLIDTSGLTTNLQTATKLVKDAAKEMNDAIAQSSNLKNFEATLSSNQVIRIDSSGKIGVNVDAKAHIDSSELQSWYTEYSKTMQRDTGSKL